MSIAGFLAFVFIAFLITTLFSFGFKVRGPWGSYWSFFLILLLAIWVSGVWVDPIGPKVYDIYWLPPLVVGFFFALLLAAATPSPKEREHLEMKTNRKYKPEAIQLGTFFWLLLIIMFALIIFGVVNNDVVTTT